MATDQGYLKCQGSPEAEDNTEITVLKVVGSRVSGWRRGAWGRKLAFYLFAKALVRNVLRLRRWNSRCEMREVEVKSKTEGTVRLGEVRDGTEHPEAGELG